MISRREFFKRCTAGAAALLAWTSCGCGQKNKTATVVKENPYEYNIEQFKKVDPGLILYEEVPPITVKTKQLKGLAISDDDTVFVIGDRRVFIYDSHGNLANRFTLKEVAYCLDTIDGTNIFIGMKEHVEVFDATGTRISTWNSLGETASVTSLAAHNNHVVVADHGNKQLWIFTAEGKLQGFIDEGFVVPSPYFAVDFDNDGNIWVVNPGRLRLEKYTPAGTRISSWGKASMELDGFPGCCNPTHFAIGQGGEFITAEKGIARLKIYDNQGTLQGVVAGPDKFKEGTTGLDLDIDSKGRVFVTDSVQRKVRIFAPKKGS